MVEFRAYEPGESVLVDDAIYEVVKAARTRWGSPTYLIRERGAESGRKWLTPDREGAPLHVVDRASIRTFVERFYARVGDDPLLGPVFEARLHGEWGPHLDTMVSFWSAVLLREPGYQGTPPVVHRAISELSPAHFGRWLELFAQTMESIFAPETAARLIERSRGIGQMLSTAVLGQPWDA